MIMISSFLFKFNSFVSSFLTTSFFTTFLSLLKSTGVVSNFAISNLSTLLFKWLKSFNTLFNLSISNLLTSGFKLTKSDFAASLDVSVPVAFFKSVFFSVLESIDSFYTMSFLSIKLLNESS